MAHYDAPNKCRWRGCQEIIPEGTALCSWHKARQDDDLTRRGISPPLDTVASGDEAERELESLFSPDTPYIAESGYTLSGAVAILNRSRRSIYNLAQKARVSLAKDQHGRVNLTGDDIAAQSSALTDEGENYSVLPFSLEK